MTDGSDMKLVLTSAQLAGVHDDKSRYETNGLIRFTRDIDEPSRQSRECWQLLVVDDEPDWHSTIRLALEDITVEGRPLKLLYATSGKEALQVLSQSSGIALILLDVVMESEQSGLELVREVREHLNNHHVQIAIVTGQPAYAPERMVVEQYQINDYRLKADLTAEKLTALVCTSIRAYKSLCELIDSRENLKKMAHARREAERRYQDLYDLAPDMYASVEADTARITQCNQVLVDYLGYDGKGEIIGKQIFDIHHPACLDKVKEAFRCFLETGEVCDVELCLHRKDGSSIDSSLNVRAVRNAQGRIMEAHASWRDIRERKASEAAIRESEERYRAIFGQAAVGLARVATDGSWLEVNDRLCDIVGYQRSELLRKTFQEITHPEDLDANLEYVRQMLAGERRCFSMEKRYFHKDGHIVWINLTVSLVYDQNLEPKYFVAVIEDIIQRKHAEDRLRQAAAVFKSTAEGVIITDLDGTIIDVNQAFNDITGYIREEVLGQNPRVLKSGRHDTAFYRDMWRDLISRGEWHGEIWNRRKNGNIYPELLTISTVRDELDEPVGYVGVFTDITSDKQTQHQLRHMAYHDPLTDLPNRRFFNTRLSQSIVGAARRKTALAVVFVDLDHFKYINDSMGHEVGDELLIQLARRLRKTIRASDALARISGDEFVLLVEDIKNDKDASVIVRKLINELKEPYELRGQRVRVTCSIGISLYPQDGNDAAELLRNADTAMYRAKEEGRNRYQFYKQEMTSSALEHVLLENALRVAQDQQELHLAYQPQVNIETGTLIGLEALLRWKHSKQDYIPPALFIPIAEQSGLIHDIGAWVLQHACAQAKSWLDRGIDIGRMAVNVAGSQIQHDDFVAIVSNTLILTGLPSERLALEVTESFMMSHSEESISQLKALQAMGIEIAIDDFGTGYSSLSHLKQLPIDKLKIDQSFVRDIPEDTNDMAISEAVIALGQALNMRVIAEGVETELQAAFLREKGCQEAQGYLYSKPVEAEQLEDWLNKQ